MNGIASEKRTLDPAALSIELRPDPAGEGPTTISIRHPTAPFWDKIDLASFSNNIDQRRQYAIRDLVYAYLEQLFRHLKTLGVERTVRWDRLKEWLRPLHEQISTQIAVKIPGEKDKETHREDDVQLAWLPLLESNPPVAEKEESVVPFSSFWFHEDGEGENTLVISISEAFIRNLVSQDINAQDKKIQVFPRGSGIGIRVVAHIHNGNQGAAEELRITSMSASLPTMGPEQFAEAREGAFSIENLGFDANEIVEEESEALAILLSGAAPVATDEAELRKVKVLQQNVFLQDPVSQKPKKIGDQTHTLRERRPTRGNEILKQYRKLYVKYAPIVEGSPGDQRKTEDALLRVMRSKIVDEDREKPEALYSGEDLPLRSNAFSAYNGLRNTLELFERFERYSIEPERYFRSAKLPLDVRYRSGMPYGPGRDGQTVNAAVQPVDWSGDKPVRWRRHQIAPQPNQDPPRLELRLALANLSHRRRFKAKGQARSPAEPLGIAADPRWMWHEFGHVLLMATTGELEMRFAHSPGDALAAIASDPKSHLAADEKLHRWRGATFPWVFIPRRHDRCVYRGWSWSGAMHRPLRELPDRKQPRRKGYRSEQILSTSLFRLYLCLGGDTTKPGTSSEPDVERRQAASDYTLFLIMKGLGMLGDARIVPANHPDQFVSALIDVDIGTERFDAKGDKIFERVGGCAHKTIRWAFEAQGLYADDATNNNNIGRPPEVDIYIKDQRPEIEEWLDCPVEHGPGSYVPVSLEVPRSGLKWFADDSVRVENGKIHVTVRNRGSKEAENVSVKVSTLR